MIYSPGIVDFGMRTRELGERDRHNMKGYEWICRFRGRSAQSDW